MCKFPGRPVLGRCLSAHLCASSIPCCCQPEQSTARAVQSQVSWVGHGHKTTHLHLPHCSWSTSDSDAGRCTAYSSKCNPFFWYPNSLVSSHFFLVIMNIAKNPSWRTPTAMLCSIEPVSTWLDPRRAKRRICCPLCTWHLVHPGDLLLCDMVTAEVNPWDTGLNNA